MLFNEGSGTAYTSAPELIDDMVAVIVIYGGLAPAEIIL